MFFFFRYTICFLYSNYSADCILNTPSFSLRIMIIIMSIAQVYTLDSLLNILICSSSIPEFLTGIVVSVDSYCFRARRKLMFNQVRDRTCESESVFRFRRKCRCRLPLAYSRYVYESAVCAVQLIYDTVQARGICFEIVRCRSAPQRRYRRLRRVSHGVYRIFRLYSVYPIRGQIVSVDRFWYASYRFSRTQVRTRILLRTRRSVVRRCVNGNTRQPDEASVYIYIHSIHVRNTIERYFCPLPSLRALELPTVEDYETRCGATSALSQTKFNLLFFFVFFFFF